MDSSSISNSEAAVDAAEVDNVSTYTSRPHEAFRFCVKACIFFGLLFVVLNLAAIWIPESINRDIFGAIQAADIKSTEHILLLGDSVARQQFLRGPIVPDIDVLTTNQAISMVGQYILAARVLDSGTPIQKIVLLAIPKSFRNNLDQIYTFGYFVRPFYRRQFEQYLTPQVYERLRRKPYWLNRFPVVRKTWLGSEIDYSDGKPEPSSNFLSPISIEYLKKMDGLARAKGIQFRVLSSPISSAVDTDFRLMKQQIHAAGLDEAFEGYFANMDELDSSAFQDNTHLLLPLVEKYRTIALQRIRNLQVPETPKESTPSTRD